MPESGVLDAATRAETIDRRRRPSVHLMSVATELPEHRLSSAEIAAQIGKTEDWIVSRTGIRERPRVAEGDRLSDFAARAGAKALKAAGVDAADLDLVIVASITQDEQTPSAAPLVATLLGAVRAGAFDIGAACTGFLAGLSVAVGQIESGRAKRILLIGADFCSRFIRDDDKMTAPLFSDAAGAVVIGAGEPHTSEEDIASGQGWVGPIMLGADGSGGDYLRISPEDGKLRMDGPEVFRHAVSRMHDATLDAISAAGTRIADIDLFVYHQANARITKALRERLELAEERVVDCIERMGNSTAATLPLALAHAQEDGRLKRGTRVLLSAFGAGFTWGACVLHWSGTDADAPPAASPSPSTSADSAPSAARV